MHELKNEYLSIKVNPVGAELSSLKNRKTGIEHLWQGNPEFWSSRAPNLFPVIGVLKDDKYIFEDKEYSMPKHGFVRYNEDIQLKEETDNSLTFELNYSKKTLAIYPFKFRFEISFILSRKSLKIHHKIFNLDENSLYFSLGGHPAFNAPLSNNEVYEDYYLEFDQKMDLSTYVLSDKGLLSDKTEGILDNEDKIRLHKDLFSKDALIFKNIPSKKVALKSKNTGTVLNVEYPDFKNLGIWAKPGAPYVCVEPWLGITDIENTNQNLITKEGIEILDANKSFEAAYIISIN